MPRLAVFWSAAMLIASAASLRAQQYGGEPRVLARMLVGIMRRRMQRLVGIEDRRGGEIGGRGGNDAELAELLFLAAGQVDFDRRLGGKPVAFGAEVVGRQFGPAQQAAVDGNGRFEATVPAGKYEHLNIQTDTRGYPNIEHAFTIEGGKTTELGDVMIDLK